MSKLRPIETRGSGAGAGTPGIYAHPPVFRRPDGRWTTVPLHRRRDVVKGALRKILRDTEVTVEEFERLK